MPHYYLEKDFDRRMEEIQIMENYNSLIVKKKDNRKLLWKIQIISK